MDCREKFTGCEQLVSYLRTTLSLYTVIFREECSYVCLYCIGVCQPVLGAGTVASHETNQHQSFPLSSPQP